LDEINQSLQRIARESRRMFAGKSSCSRLNYLYDSNQSNIMEKLESIVKVSGKGQIVIPKEVRDALGIKSGGKLAVIVRDDEIILRKIERLDLLEMSSRISSVVERENIDVDKLIVEAVEWARKQR